MKYCTNCGTPHYENAVFCTNCGKRLIETSKKTANEKNQKTDSILNHVYDYIGSEKDVRVDWRMLFSDVFMEHTNEEAERIFVCGTSFTTPDPSTISTNFPRPWLYGRIFIGLLVTFVLLWICSAAFNNLNALPGTIVIGSFVVPLSTMMLFFEMNVWRNISF